MIKHLRKYRILDCLLISLFMGFYVSNTLFIHTHFYPGYSVTHSHPCSKNAEGLPCHTHNANEIRIISSFNASVFFATDTAAAEEVFSIPAPVRFYACSGEAACGETPHCNLRAPPPCLV